MAVVVLDTNLPGLDGWFVFCISLKTDSDYVYNILYQDKAVKSTLQKYFHSDNESFKLPCFAFQNLYTHTFLLLVKHSFVLKPIYFSTSKFENKQENWHSVLAFTY